jgi:PAS domain S-box-containing protein
VDALRRGILLSEAAGDRTLNRVSEYDVSLARLAAIVSSSDDAIVSKDLNGYIQTWNAGAERLFGFTSDEAVGKHITLIIPDDRRPEEDHVLKQVRAGIGVAHYETIRRHKDGTLLNISLTVSPVRDADGTIVAASKIARDITDQKRLQRIADEASRAKDEFLATLSHELRTPLNAVTGYIMMLRQGKLDAVQQERALDVMARNAEALTNLVSDLLDSSQFITGRIRLDFREYDLAQLVSDAVESLRPSALLKQLQLEARLPPTLPGHGDPDRLRQVLWNVLTNAVKYTPTGGAISVVLEQTGGVASIVVTDTGVGIPQGSLTRVFQRFWQEDTVSENGWKGGLGLGLALARHFVELHGGTITAASPGRGMGSTFRIELPMALAAPV